MKSSEFLREANMSRAAKGHEKYGKEGMEALAKAGREGAGDKELDRIRDKHNKYDESIDETTQRLDPKCWKGKHKEGTKIKGGVRVNNCVPNESVAEDYNAEYDDEAGMADNNLETLKRAVSGIDDVIDSGDNLPEWCQEKIAVAKSMLVAVWDYLQSEETYDGDEFYEAYGDLWYAEDSQLNEAEYHGHKVTLGKPMQGDVKKFKVYVKDPSTGNIKKVNFGDPNMRIKKSNPARRRSFRARHNCDNPGPKTKARYWSCRKW